MKKIIILISVIITLLGIYFIYNRDKENMIYIYNDSDLSFNDMSVQFQGNVNRNFQAKKETRIPRDFVGKITIQINNKGLKQEHIIAGYYEYAFQQSFKVHIVQNINNQLELKIIEKQTFLINSI